MTAFLTVDVLRAHAAPVEPRDFGRRPVAPRSVLSAQWRIAPDGRLACDWLTDDPAPDRPPF